MQGSLMSMQGVTFLVGLALIVIGIFGGGIEVKEIKIPTLPVLPRSLSVAVGLVLMVLCITSPQLFPGAPATPGPTTAGASQSTTFVSPPYIEGKRFLGLAIQNQLITVREVKIVLRRLGKYNGVINDEVNEGYFQAVADFQASQKIDVDGLVGPQTYGKFREAWPDYFVAKVVPPAAPGTGATATAGEGR